MSRGSKLSDESTDNHWGQQTYNIEYEQSRQITTNRKRNPSTQLGSNTGKIVKKPIIYSINNPKKYKQSDGLPTQARKCQQYKQNKQNTSTQTLTVKEGKQPENSVHHHIKTPGYTVGGGMTRCRR